ncbi:thiamine pyrophosphate-binding protein [Streptomonospora salina]|uniref:Thiamine pyrophosphate-dependent acetolactate synthase large subunit-like protein n=1 Tax=Streptomonospora salina TaxID=104205 RepID=A0A841E8V6_9ACTN|nr:thiamine pyrophosphate-binding protein [Streptomonospora salina]MBB5996950.1 thiamine pyrophosphate-dependent acetolactate synthase large subunit-like protein [Streptomonospora salina]
MSVTGRASNGAEAVGATLAACGIDTVYGVVGSGNFVATDALVRSGARFAGARHEAGALAMADAHWRTTGRIAACSVHQGPGLTNTLTALAEAAKSRSPVVVIAGATSAGMTRSNFYLEQAALITAAGGAAEHLHRPDTVTADTARAFRRAIDEQRPVVLNMALDVQAATALSPEDPVAVLEPAGRPQPAAHVLAELAEDLLSASRPVLLAGRGAWLSGARAATAALADRVGARLATTAVVKGMFTGHPRDVGIAGGFSDPAAVETLESADLIVALGATLTTWTTRGDTIFRGPVKVVQIDREHSALGRNGHVDVGIVADADATVCALLAEVGDRPGASRFGPVERSAAPVAPRPSAEGASEGTCHPADITARLEEMLPAERSVVLDGGHFIGWPAMGWSVPDPAGFVFTSAGFQSIGLGLGAAAGAAVARPDRLTVLATGDGGFLMAVSELETLVRLNLDVLVVVYDDRAYGAEVHHFFHHGSGLDLVRFPDADIAGIARGAGARAVTVREQHDLAQAADWFAEPRGVLVLDVRIDPTVVGPWADQDFAGH